MARTQWLLFHLMEHGEVFCVKGTLMLAETVDGKSVKRREIPREAWQEVSGKAVMCNCG